MKQDKNDQPLRFAHEIATAALGIAPIGVWYGIFPTISILLLVGTFTFTAQGQDLLAALVWQTFTGVADKDSLPRSLFFVVGFCAAVLALGYSSRLSMRAFLIGADVRGNDRSKVAFARSFTRITIFTPTFALGSGLLVANGLVFAASCIWLIGFLATPIAARLCVRASSDQPQVRRVLVLVLAGALAICIWSPHFLRVRSVSVFGNIDFLGWYGLAIGGIVASIFVAVLLWLGRRVHRSQLATFFFRAVVVSELYLITHGAWELRSAVVHGLYVYLLWQAITGMRCGWRTVTNLRGIDRIAKRVFVGCSFVLFGFIASFNFAPERAAGLLGSPAIILFFISLLTCLGAIFFVWFPTRNNLPPTTFVAFLAILIFSPFNDNHALRMADEPYSYPSVRWSTSDDFIKWYDAASQGDPDYPVFIIAAAGGGLRAAYWASAVLSNLEDNTCGEFHKHVYAISGVSGGSLGAAAFDLSLLEDFSPGERAKCEAESWGERSSERTKKLTSFVSGDYLSPTVGSLLFSDFAQAFAPYPFLRDRAFGLETSWESRWRRAFNSDDFAKPVGAVFDKLASEGLPRLVFNSTRVEDGRRVVLSSTKIDPSDGYDLFEEIPRYRGMPLSTAVHASARFTFVSPAATALKFADDGQATGPWGRLVDGGYFDNSGAASLSDLTRQIAANWSMLGREGKPRLIALLLSNDPDDTRDFCGSGSFSPVRADSVVSAPRVARWLPEVLSPLDTLLGTREARAPFHERELIEEISSAFERQACESVVEIRLGEYEVAATTPSIFAGAFVEQDVLTKSIPKPPLGWFLEATSAKALLDTASGAFDRVPFRYAPDCFFVAPNIRLLAFGEFDRCSGTYESEDMAASRWIGLLGTRDTVSVDKALEMLRGGGCIVVAIVNGELQYGDFTWEGNTGGYNNELRKEDVERLAKAIPRLGRVYLPPDLSIKVNDGTLVQHPVGMNPFGTDPSGFVRKLLTEVSQDGDNMLIIAHRRIGALADAELAYLRDNEIAVYRQDSAGPKFLARIKPPQWSRYMPAMPDGLPNVGLNPLPSR